MRYLKVFSPNNGSWNHGKNHPYFSDYLIRPLVYIHLHALKLDFLTSPNYHPIITNEILRKKYYGAVLKI